MHRRFVLRGRRTSYGAAFLNGLAWNAVNITIMVALLIRARQRLAMA